MKKRTAVLILLFTSAAAHADTTATFLLQFGSYGSGDGQFHSVSGIALDSQGNVFVSDAVSDGRIQVFDGQGQYQRTLGGFVHSDGSVPGSLAISPGEFVYVARSPTAVIEKLTTQGAPVTAWTVLLPGESSLSDHALLAVDAAENVFAVCPQSRTIRKFDSDGHLLAYWHSHDGQTAGGFSGEPAIGPDGNLYVLENGDHVNVYAPDSTFLRSWSCAGKSPEPASGLWIDSTGRVYVTEFAGADVLLFDLNGASLGGWDYLSTGAPYDAWGEVVSDPSGSAVYVTAISQSHILKFGLHAVPTQPFTWGKIKAAWRSR